LLKRVSDSKFRLLKNDMIIEHIKSPCTIMSNDQYVKKHVRVSD